MATRTKLTGLDFITAARGTEFIDDTSTHTGIYEGFRVDADAVVNACTNERDQSIMDDLGLTGATLPANTLVRYGGDYIKTIDLTSGKVTMIKG